MRQTALLISSGLALMTATGAASAQDQRTSSPLAGGQPREVVIPDDPRPATRAPEDHNVAVLKLALEVEGGRTQNASVQSIRQVNSYAPKVFARQGGDWKVMIGDRASYTVNDPASDVEVENSDNERSPYSEVPMNGMMETTLVVPLYGPDGEPFDASVITITDMRTDRTLVQVPVR